MASSRNKTEQSKEKPTLVCCKDCKNEVRDTEGSSFSIETGEFFLCGCTKGHAVNKFGQTAKLFIDEKRVCEDFDGK